MGYSQSATAWLSENSLQGGMALVPSSRAKDTEGLMEVRGLATVTGLSMKSDHSPKSALGAGVSAMSSLSTRNFGVSLRRPGDQGATLEYPSHLGYPLFMNMAFSGLPFLANSPSY